MKDRITELEKQLKTVIRLNECPYCQYPNIKLVIESNFIEENEWMCPSCRSKWWVKLVKL